ncbi:MAG: ABC transporter permease, partial [Bacteroidetes bacterium]|nr:ABC transporter permease [Bacteroidota bacterium]
MLKNYIKTALRNLARNKAFALINIAGLGIGIAACLLIFIVIRFEQSFDSFHSKKDRIYRVTTWFDRTGNPDYNSGISVPVPASLRIDFPQLEAVSALASDGNALFSIDNGSAGIKKIKLEKGAFYAEPQISKVFDLQWLAGNPATALTEPNTAVLSQSQAELFFGSWKEAMGRTLIQDTRKQLKVTGIIKDMPVNSDFPFRVLMSFKSSRMAGDTDWGSTSSSHNCLIVLPRDMTEAQMEAQLPGFFDKHRKNDNGNIKASYHLQPLGDIHFDSRFGNFNDRTFSKKLINALSLIGLFLLIIACVNFINLATAQAVNRSKEVGVRKVLGGSRRQLALQFLGETFMITLCAVVLALLLSFITLPMLARLLELPLGWSRSLLPVLGLFLLLTTVLVTLLSGLYPALILAGFNPITALKSRMTTQSAGGLSLRRGLVVLQFAIAQVLIIGTLVVVSQMRLFKNTEMGFTKDAIVITSLPSDSISRTKTNALRAELLSQPAIKNLSYSYTPPSSGQAWSSDFNFDHSPTPTPFEPSLKWADANYISTYDLTLVAGRNYTETDTVREFLVNESVVGNLGLKSPSDILGKELNFWGGVLKGPVVGVVKDFHDNSLRDPISPIVMACRKINYGTIGVRIDMAQSKQALAALEKTWNKYFPDYLYEYKFLDESIAGYYKQETQLSKLYTAFAAIAIFISCLGLYGLVSFMAVQRTREVGIRKVLGASIANILYLFSKEFTVLIGIAFVIAAPVAWYIMHQWLDNFALKVSLGAGFFALAIIGSLLVAWITVGYKAFGAAMANPVKSL